MDYFIEKYAEIIWQEKKSIVMVTFKGYMNSEQLRAVYENVRKCAEKYNGKNILVDGRLFVTIKPNDQLWLVNEWLPKAVDAGIRKIARVLPDNLIQRMVISKMDIALHGKFELKEFSDIEEGIMWLN